MKNFREFYLRFLQQKSYFLGLFLLLTLSFYFSIYTNLFDERRRLKIDNTLEPFFSRESFVFDFYKEMEKEFGNDKQVIFSIQPPVKGQFDLDFFQALNEFDQELISKIPVIKDNYSLLDSIRTSGLCAGKSFFHLTLDSNYCINLLEINAKLDSCFQGGSKASESALEIDLESSLEILPDSFDQDDILASGNNNLECPPDIYFRSKKEWKILLSKKVKQVFDEIGKEAIHRHDIISSDKTAVGLLSNFKADSSPHVQEVQKRISDIVNKFKSKGIKISYAGRPRDEFESSRILKNDIEKILPVSILLILLVLFRAFKSIRGIVVPLVTVISGLVWTFGIFGVFGSELNLVTLIIPVILIAIGTAYVIHFLNLYYQNARDKTLSVDEVIANSIEKIALPTAITGLTTLIGFGALLTSPIPAVQQMGFYTCVGILIIVFFVFTLAPCLISFLPNFRQGSSSIRRSSSQKILTILGANIDKYSKEIIVGWAILGFIACLGMINLRIDSETKTFLNKAPITIDKNDIQNKLGGINLLRVIISEQEGGDNKIVSAEAMNKILEFREWIQDRKNSIHQIKGVRFDNIYTPLEYLKVDLQSLENLKDEEIRSFFVRAKKNKVPKFLSDDAKLLSLSIRLKMTSTASFLEFKNQINEKLKVLLPNFTIRYTGSAVLASQSASNIIEGQILSILIAVLFIFGILSLLFFSFKIGLLAILPNLLSITVFFGLLGYLNIPIGITISTIASIALGIGVDDTIHFIIHYNQDLKRLKVEREAVQMTLRKLGKPMIFTTLALSLGFAIFVISRMESQVFFGILTAFTLIICLGTDIYLLPAILIRTKIITAWDYLYLNYSQDFLNNIELFRGMSLREAKIATLFIQSIEVEKGEYIYRESDAGEDLFILLQGEVEIFIEQQFHHRKNVLQSIQQGQFFGELGLFPGSIRMNTARTRSVSHLLVLNQQSLLNLKKNTPAIATKLFLNLSRSLENRIQNQLSAFLNTIQNERDLGSINPESNFDKKEIRLNNFSKILNKIEVGKSRIKSKKKNIKGKFFNNIINYFLLSRDSNLIENRSGKNESEVEKLLSEVISSEQISYQQKLKLQYHLNSKSDFTENEEKLLEVLKGKIDNHLIQESKPEFASIFNEFSDRERDWIRNENDCLLIPEGEKVFSKGDFAFFMMAVVSGKLVSEIEVNAQKIKISTVIPGDLVGEMFLVGNSTKRMTNLFAMEDSEVIFLSEQGFLRMMKKNKNLAAQFSYNMVGLLSHRLRKSTFLFFDILPSL